MMRAARLSFRDNRRLGLPAAFQAARVGAQRTRDRWQTRWVILSRPLHIHERRQAFPQGACIELTRATADELVRIGWAVPAADPLADEPEWFRGLLDGAGGRAGETRPIANPWARAPMPRRQK
jgi:hypothetical protein